MIHRYRSMRKPAAAAAAVIALATIPACLAFDPASEFVGVVRREMADQLVDIDPVVPDVDLRHRRVLAELACVSAICCRNRLSRSSFR